MCGIAGVAGVEPVSARVLDPMLEQMASRGPNWEGKDVWGTAVLGHRRLSIFDLSEAGRQPMLSRDGKTGVVFNGAIYNFRFLRAELETFGYRFNSNTDTEVLLHGYSHWGIDRLVARLRGMFAFGIWDDVQRKMYLVRDRLGVKPLVYSTSGGQIAFASTVRALRSAGFGGGIDRQAVIEFLEYGFITEARSIYEHILKVPAAHILEWEGGRATLRRYWNRAEITSNDSFETAVDRTEELILEATRLRLDADVPVGTLLSGGVDSSLICWALAKQGANITAFTVGTPGNAADETNDAVMTARALGIRHQIIPLSPELSPSVEDMVSAYGEPFACSSALGMMRVSNSVKESATVLLTGDGGDDVFLGYPAHLNLYRAQQLARLLPPGATNSWQWMRNLLAHGGPARRLKHFIDYSTGGLGAVIQAPDGLPYYSRSGIPGPQLRDAVLPEREIPWSSYSARHVLDEYLEYEHNYRFRCEYLTKVDGATMHYAMEARSPFLDQELWEYAGSLRYDVRLKGGKMKAILRELARRHLGNRIARGAKRGFTIPVLEWIAGRWKNTVEDAFRNSLLVRDGWLNSEGLLGALRQAEKQGTATNHLWYCYVLDAWYRTQYIEAGKSHNAAIVANRSDSLFN